MEESDEQRPRRRATWIVTVLLCALVIYPLSAGPVNWLIGHGYIDRGPDSPIKGLHLPLKWLAENFPAFGRLLFWYLEFWE